MLWERLVHRHYCVCIRAARHGTEIGAPCAEAASRSVRSVATWEISGASCKSTSDEEAPAGRPLLHSRRWDNV
jgi:hypothetical protein